MSSITSDNELVFRNLETRLGSLEYEFTYPTPVSTITEDSTYKINAHLLQLAGSFGTPMSIPHVRRGAVVQDIFPTEHGAEKASSSYGSEKEFAFHNDQSYSLDESEFPHFVLLGCIRNIEKAGTLIASIEQVKSELDEGVIAQLEQPNYTLGHMYKQPDGTKKLKTITSPVLLRNGEVRLGVDMVPADEDSARALQTLREAVLENSIRYSLESGEVVVIPNRTFVHARESFTMAKLPNQRRWLKRINISNI